MDVCLFISALNTDSNLSKSHAQNTCFYWKAYVCASMVAKYFGQTTLSDKES